MATKLEATSLGLFVCLSVYIYVKIHMKYIYIYNIGGGTAKQIPGVTNKSWSPQIEQVSQISLGDPKQI